MELTHKSIHPNFLSIDFSYVFSEFEFFLLSLLFGFRISNHRRIDTYSSYDNDIEHLTLSNQFIVFNMLLKIEFHNVDR